MPTKSRRAGGWCAAALLCFLPAPGVATDSPVVATERHPELYEQAFDVSDRAIPLNRRTPVDVNSQLQLRFLETTGIRVTAAAPADWQRLQNILEQVRSLAAERKSLNAQARSSLATLDPIRVRDAARAFNKRANQLIDDWEAALRPGEAKGLQGVLTGEELDGANPSLPYENLGRWLTGEIDRLQAENRAELAKHQVEVNVSAFLQHGVSEPRRIGVPGYDNIAIGSPEPISKTGLKLTTTEAAQLDARLKATQEVAALLRQIQDEWSETNQNLSGALATLGTQIKNLPRELRGHINSINSLGDLRTALTELKAKPDLDAAKIPAIDRLLAACTSFEQDIQKLKDKISTLTQLYQVLRGGADPTMLSDLAGALGKLTTAAGSLQKTATDTLALIQQWSKNLAGLEGDLATVAPLVADEKIAPLHDLVLNVKDTVATLQPIVTAAKGIMALLGSSNGFDQVPKQLAAVKVDENWFKAQAAPATQIALDSVGLVPGDRLQVKVTYRAAGGVPPTPPEIFFVETTEFGRYRKIDASLIFARPLKSPTDGQPKRWRPNAAATAHWFYRWRPDAKGQLTAGRSTWNFINPGFGIHAASLAQGNDSVEVGLGVNLSLLDGMLSGGYGYNLSTEKPYVYVGIGLLEVLDRARRPAAGAADAPP